MPSPGDLVEVEEKSLLQEILKSFKVGSCSPLVTHVVGAKGENNLGLIYRIHTDSKNYILKIPPKHRFEAIDLAFEREIYAYEKLLKFTEEFQNEHNIPQNERPVYPKCFKTSSQYSKEYLILEDMNEAGYTMADKKVGLDLKQVKCALKSLARFHAISFKLEKTNPGVHKEWFEKSDDVANYYKNPGIGIYQTVSFEKAMETIDDKICIDKMNEFKDKRNSKYLEMAGKRYDRKYAVFYQGDAWTNNILYKYQGEELLDCCLIDWQMYKYGSPVLEISFLIFMSTTEEFRKENLSECLDFYYECLKQRVEQFQLDMNIVYPRKIFEEQLNEFMCFGLILAIVMLPMLLVDEGDTSVTELMGQNCSYEGLNVEWFGNEISKNRYRERMGGIIRDCVKFGYI